MKAIMLMFDSLNRHMLECYGCDWVDTPNFKRLAERAVTFDKCYVGSMPCMPARRELHTGRYNFLHRSWGPLEPFDDSTPELLKQNGIYTHISSDHYHYWEEGGCTYHTRYSSWECFRGQEGDPWKGDLGVEMPDSRNLDGTDNSPRSANLRCKDMVNRKYIVDEADYPQVQTLTAGMEFMRTNADQDNWFLHIETFDPHEPYQVPQRFLDKYPHDYNGRHWDWPPYQQVTEDAESVEHMRKTNAALVSMCDEYLGKFLDTMDELNLWEDTMLIVNTDHGFLLGEHEHWAKCHIPFYEEVAHTPLFIYDPRRPQTAGQRRSSLIQTIDLPATLLDYFNIDLPKDMQGRAATPVIESDTPIRDYAMFGTFGAQVNVTDGQYVYMRGPATEKNSPSFEYTLMPTHMRRTFGVQELQDIQLAEPMSFTKGCRTMKIASKHALREITAQTYLWDVNADPKQQQELKDNAVEAKMISLLKRAMQENDSPAEQYERLGLD